MTAYKVWVRVTPTQTVHVIIYADNDNACKLIADAQYGIGNVLNYMRIGD